MDGNVPSFMDSIKDPTNLISKKVSILLKYSVFCADLFVNFFNTKLMETKMRIIKFISDKINTWVLLIF